jgi:hypothetical protein
MSDVASALLPVKSKLSIKELEEYFRKFTLDMYNTWVSFEKMEEDCIKFVHEDIVFKDPWQNIFGIKNYGNAAKGFHSGIYFDFDIHQVNISMNEKQDRGRCIIDGNMNLKQFQFYSYPLRTILVYDFVMVDDGSHFLITLHEEMWSFGDMIENLPLGIGKFYNGFRYLMGQFVLWMFFYISILMFKSFRK